ncbi:hypothetical protein LTR53_010949 [Teratosphaeriaceae sp. CCFEE 6253]|nr:hypothetical protein LTR53_010949 [Teratosphaeriaceae sp. CCFEE 6253]
MRTHTQRFTFSSSMAQPQSFTIDVPSNKIDEIRCRMESYPWDSFGVPSNQLGDDDWAYGPPPSYMQALCHHWLNDYDWTARQARMNKLPHYMSLVDGFDIHYVHLRGSGTGGTPVLLLHGWPYSFHSFHDIAHQLAFPDRFGGKAEDGVDVIIPSMPGYDFSPAAASVTGPGRVAELYNTLVTSTLGCGKYVAHGGDWGSYISELLAFRYPEHCAGIHLTMSSVRHHGAEVRTGVVPSDATDTERVFAAEEYRRWEPESAYAKLQGTKAVKLGYAMADSPVGVAAWIIEAFHAWSDLSSGRRFEDVYGFDTLLDEVMLYLVTNAFHTSIWIYIGEGLEGSNVLPPGASIEVPTAIMALPDPVFPMMPRAMAEKSRRVVRYTRMSHGGHFPFYEVGDELVTDLQDFLRELQAGRHARQ